MTQGGDQPRRRWQAAHVLGSLAALTGLALVALPLPAMPVEMRQATGAVIIAVGLWSTGALPEHLTAVLFFFVAMVFAVAPPEVVFSGFHSTAVWLVFGGVVLATAVGDSGLGARIVEALLGHLPRSYFAMILAVAAVGAGLAFLIPAAMGRVVLYIPLVVALTERLGYTAASPGHTALVLAGILGTMMPAFCILPSNVPNMVLVGAAETLLDVHLGYGEYLALNYPVMGLLTLLAIALVVRGLFPDRPRTGALTAERRPWSAAEARLLALLVAALALWVSDFAHGISPAWVALGAALLCLLPGIGVLAPTAIAGRINFGPWLFVAGTIGMGAVASHGGLGRAIGEMLLAHLPFGRGPEMLDFAALLLVGGAVGTVTTLPAVPAILTPLAGQLSAASGWSIESVLMAQVPTWVFFPFPYEAPPLVVGMALGRLGVYPTLRCLLAILVLGILVILPLQFLWGRFLGYYG